MSTLRRGSLTVPVAPVGSDNPLPPLAPIQGVHEGVEAAEADADMARNLAYGHLGSLLPYTVQDGYTRDRVERRVATAVLENDTLRATFLPGWGGRLWSLVHLSTGRELLYRNPVLQPANFALRGAWFSGGVEWNIGATGHSPLTCSPVHAARMTHDDGTPVLRLYEWERARGVAFQVDAWLPHGSPTLLVHIRIVNPNDHDVPMYWWSNIAVPETPETRVLAPANEAYHFSYDQRLRVVPVPGEHGSDLTYPADAGPSADYFFECREARQPWIAALERDGRGLVQTSTAALAGRKLFVWGHSPGGKHWQEFLSGENSDQEYCEIQAGLARTQLEHLPMPAGARWSWTEAYGPLTVDPGAAHGPWSEATAAVADALTEVVPTDLLERAHAETSAQVDRVPEQALCHGTGWGALEHRMRRITGGPPLDLPGMPFPDETLAEPQQPWLRLLDSGRMPRADTENPPRSFVTGRAWLRLLEDAPDGWLTWLHRGVARWAAGDNDGARQAWHASTQSATNAWALRNLGFADHLAGRPRDAADRYLQAHSLCPGQQHLTIEALAALVHAGRPCDALDLIEALPARDRDTGRVRLAEARAALDAGDTDRAGKLLDDGITVPDLREGADTLHRLWFDHRAAVGAGDEPLPYVYDFRMHP